MKLWRFDAGDSGIPPLYSILHFLLRLGKSFDFVTDQLCFLDQRRQWFQVARSGMQFQKVEPDSFQCSDTRRQIR